MKLDREILSFIRRYSEGPSPDPAFGSLATRVFKFQFENNPNYGKFCLTVGKTPSNVRHWREIPAIPSAGFRELVLTTFPVKKAVRVFKTSGTTGGTVGASATRTSADAPRGAHFFDTLTLTKAAIIPPFRHYLLPATKASAGLRPDTHDLAYFYLIHSPKDSPNSSLSYMVSVVDEVFAGGRGRYYMKGENACHDALAKDLKICRKSAVILATAFSLKAFLEVLKKRKLAMRLPPGSRIMETGGFKGRVKEVSKKELHGECRRRLGVDPAHCVSEYGMTELSSQFYDTTLRDKMLGVERRPFKTGPAWTRTLVVDPQTGKMAKKGSVGVLRHFDLANRGSVMAIQTEDLGREVGEGFELTGRAKSADLRGCSLTYEEFLGS